MIVTSMTADGIRVAGVSKRYRDVLALDEVSLEVQPGHVLALLGPNGAGKSTLLHILGTTVLPDSGEVAVAGVDVVAEPQQARAVTGAVSGDERSFYWRLSGRRNLEFFAALHGLARAAAKARADELLSMVGLADAADRRFDGYSSGMKARLGWARALLDEPPVLLLDEPSRTLDPIVARELRAMVRRRADVEGAAVLFATHDLHEAAEVADHVVVLHEGRVAATVPGGSDAAELERTLIEVTGGAG